VLIAATFLLFAAMASAEPLEIPAWRTITLYPRAALERLDSRFDLSSIRDGPRLTIVADPSEGIFDVVLEEGTRKEILPVASMSAGRDPRERTLLAGESGACVRVLLAGDAPVEAAVEGLGRRDQSYSAMARIADAGLRIFASAEEELSEEYLPGSWDVGGRRLEVSAVAGRSPAVRLAGKVVSLSLSRAPAGTDLLLVPGDGSPPSSALRLRGPDSFREVPVRCRFGGGPCEIAGTEVLWRRGGARLNR
jgi:hypothetical protein